MHIFINVTISVVAISHQQRELWLRPQKCGTTRLLYLRFVTDCMTSLACSLDVHKFV